MLMLQAQGNDARDTEGNYGQLRGSITSKIENDVFLVSFEPDSDKHPWTTVNDPVMGGASTSTITVSPGLGVWEGEVRVVQSLGAPGFCTLRTGSLGDEQHFPDPTGTEYLVVQLEAASGLPVETFSVQIGVSGLTTSESPYRAQLIDEYCCGNMCRVPWSVFEISFRGKKMDGPKLSDNLDKISRIGLGTSGTAGKFSLSINSFVATNSELFCAEVREEQLSPHIQD